MTAKYQAPARPAVNADGDRVPLQRQGTICTPLVLIELTSRLRVNGQRSH